MVRRTVTIDPDLQEQINRFRGNLLSMFGLEFDFTTAINFFAEYGMRKFTSLRTDIPIEQDFQEIFAKYIERAVSSQGQTDEDREEILNNVLNHIKRTAKARKQDTSLKST